MFLPSIDRSGALRRLLGAALHAALVLVWGGVAHAEAAHAEAAHAEVAPLVSPAQESSLLATNLQGEDDAQDRPHRIVGMCGTSAQSIGAPPPIYPGQDAIAAPCSLPGQELRRGAPVRPADVPAAVDVEHDQSAVLSTAPPFPRRLVTAGARSRTLACPGEEHRARAKRPPRS